MIWLFNEILNASIDQLYNIMLSERVDSKGYILCHLFKMLKQAKLVWGGRETSGKGFLLGLVMAGGTKGDFR